MKEGWTEGCGVSIRDGEDEGGRGRDRDLISLNK